MGFAPAACTKRIQAVSFRTMQKDAKVYIAGHRGLVGSALQRDLQSQGFTNVIVRSKAELDLRDKNAVRAFFENVRPDYVIDAAAKVGGIKANYDFPVEFLLWNLEIQNNLISMSHEFGVKKFLFLGSSCIYPKFAEQPIREDSLLTGALEPTNEPYALAKICGVRLCQAYRREFGSHFISAMPTNLYGPGDNFDLATSHVLPALIRKTHEAKIRGDHHITVWGTGNALREFVHVDDVASATRFLMENYDEAEQINIGMGEEVSIRQVVEMIREVVGFHGDLVFDTTKPDGTPRKLLDASRLAALGWRPQISLREGLQQTYEWFLKNVAT